MKQTLEEKSYAFAIRIVKMYKLLKENRINYGLGDQVLRSGTSIGANVSEGVYSVSRADFIAKYQIALKEANETKYWLKLLRDCDYISEKAAVSMITDCEELIKMLTASVMTARKNNNVK